MGPRDLATRRADALAQLAAPAVDAWVATASPEGRAHLVPLSLAWVEEHCVVAVAETSRTARDVLATRRARLGVGPTRDVVMVDAELERSLATTSAEPGDAALAAAYAGQADWDPRASEGYVFLVLRPRRVQVWREADEIPGRTVMRNGTWLSDPPATTGAPPSPRSDP